MPEVSDLAIGTTHSCFSVSPSGKASALRLSPTSRVTAPYTTPNASSDDISMTRSQIRHEALAFNCDRYGYSTDQVDEHLEELDSQSFLAWALRFEEREQVSYTSFVEAFNLNDQTLSQQLYENLIESTQIRQSRNAPLKRRYHNFLKLDLGDYWMAVF
ncbi:MAG: hypothetical protein J3Q66DRAFT_403655 [Benniella sp.]|nr:MAG: hypothetical protein J3Q66DRAFT_403655 [Benniella sp.]